MWRDAVVVLAAIVAALASVAFMVQWRDRTSGHDAEWKATGVRQLHRGHDQAQGERAWAKSRRQSATGRVWNVKKPGGVVAFDQGKERPSKWSRQ